MVARSDFSRGDIREALRQLRRAAEAADEAGSELRAVALARAAADLATAVGPSQAPPPVTVKEPSNGASVPASMVRPSDDPPLRQLLETGRAVRVVVKRSTRDDELYIVRRAQDGAPPLGAREAVIVLLEPDDGFFEPSG